MEKLGKYCKIISGYAFKSNDLSEGTEIPVIKIGNISNGNDVIIDSSTQYVSSDFLSIDEKYHIKKGDVLISLTGSHINQPNSMVGRSCRNFSDTEFLLNQRAGKVIPNENADKNYLYYLLNTESFKYSICNRAYGAANQANVSPSDIENIKWNFPSLPTQQKIASILSAYDNLIQNYKKQIEALQIAASELYKEWFVRFRFPGYQTTRFENGIPEGWKVERLSNYCKITDGTHDTPLQVEEGIPLVTGKAVKKGEIDFSIPYNISIEDHEKIKKRSGLKTGDILFSNIGTVGNSCLVEYDREFSVKNMIIFKPETIEKSMYLYYLITSDSCQQLFSAQTNGSTQQFLGLDFMRNFKILVPENSIISEFGKKQEVIYAKIRNLRK